MKYIEFDCYRTTKKDLFTYARAKNYPAFNRLINQIITRKRELPYDEIKYCQIVHSNEVLQYLHEIGVPADGLKTTIRIPAFGLNRSQLYACIPLIKGKRYQGLLPKIKENIREGLPSQLRSTQALSHHEIRAFLFRIGEEPKLVY